MRTLPEVDLELINEMSDIDITARVQQIYSGIFSLDRKVSRYLGIGGGESRYP